MSDTATDSGQAPANTVKIEDKGPAMKQITIEIPAEAVSEKIEESVATFASEAALPGFRKGRTPRKLIEKKFGKNIREDTKSQLVASAYSQAIEDNDLRVLGEPESDDLDDLEIEDGKGLTFTFTVEVLPDFELPTLEGLKLVKPMREIGDDDVAKEIENVRLFHGTLEDIDGEPEDGAYLTGHGVMKDDEDNTIIDLNGAVVQIPTPDKEGKGAILGVMVDDFAKQLGHPKPGETATITCDGPENHEDEAVRGKKLTITFEVGQAQRVVPAELEDLMNQFGMTEEQQLRDQVKSQLEQRVGTEQAQAMRAQVAHRLLSEVTLDLPEKMTGRQTARMLERRRMEMMYRGVPADEVESRIAEARGSTEEAARRELKMLFIMERISNEQDIKITEQEVNGAIYQLAMQRGARPDALRKELIESGQINVLGQQIREHKVLDQIIEKGEIEEMDAEKYNETVAKELKAD
jgi:trigger factor